MTLSTDVPVVITPKPFSPTTERLFCREGATVAQILLEAVRGGFLALGDLPRTNVYLDGERLDRGEALDLRPAAGQILNIAVEPAGGGDSQGDKVVETLIAIAVIAVSAFMGNPQGVAMGVSMLIRATLTPRFDNDKLADARNKTPLDGASNSYRPREPMPLALGSGRMVLDVAAMPYTSSENDVVWLRLIFAPHYGACQVDDLKIGETLLEDYPAADIEVEYRLTPGPYTSTLYPNDVFPEGFADELTVTRGAEPIEWEVHTAQPGAEVIELDFTFPQGLKFTKENGGILKNQVQLVIETAEVGTEDWAAQPLNGAPYYDRLGVAVPTGNFYVSAKTNDALFRTASFDADPELHLKVRVRAFDPDNDPPDQGVNKTYWSGIRSINFGSPILDDNLSLVIMKIKSSDDLNGQLPPVSAVVTPIIPVWTGSAWGAAQASGNFAACARWLVTGPAAGNPLTADEVDDSFGQAFELIEANGWDGLVDVREEASQEDVLKRLGAAGRFSTYWNGRALVAVPDWSRPSPRQIFTAKNASSYRYRRAFPDPLHAVMIEFRDLEGLDDEVFVYADGYGPDNAELIETVRPPFACTIERAYRYGRVYLLRRGLQQEVHEWQAGWDTLATTMGDRVLVRHPSILFGLTEATVAARRWAGALVTGVRLDGVATMEEGKSYAIDVRRVDGTIRGIPVVTVPGRQRELVFDTPRTAELSPARGDLLAFGEVDLVTEDLEILDVDASSDMAASIRAVLYIGAEIEALEAEPLPTGLESSLVPKVPPPQPRIIDSTGSPDGVVVAFDIDPIRSDLLKGFTVRWRQSFDPDDPDVTAQDWTPLPSLSPAARQVRTPSLEAFGFDPDDTDSLFEIDVSIQTVFRSGAVSLPGIASRVAGYRFVLPPTNFTALPGNVPAGEGLGSYPVISLSADAVTSGPTRTLEVEFRGSTVTGTESGAPEDWSYLAGLAAATPTGTKRVNGPATYDVRARWSTYDNWKSKWVYQNEVVVTVDLYDTDQVVERAITAINAIFEDDHIDLPHAPTSGVLLIEFTIDTEGGGVIVQTDVEVFTRSGDDFDLLLYIDDVYAGGSSPTGYARKVRYRTGTSASVRNPVTFSHLEEELAAGEHTFRIYGRNATNAGADVDERTLIITEFKR